MAAATGARTRSPRGRALARLPPSTSNSERALGPAPTACRHPAVRSGVSRKTGDDHENDLTTQRPNAVELPADRNAFEQLAAALAQTPFDGDLLRFSKGEYLARNDELVELGTEFVADVPGLQVGWQKWEDGKPVQHEIGYVADGYRPPRRSELGDDEPSTWEVDEQGQPRDPWQKTMYLPLIEQCDRPALFLHDILQGRPRCARRSGRRLWTPYPRQPARAPHRKSWQLAATATPIGRTARSLFPSSTYHGRRCDCAESGPDDADDLLRRLPRPARARTVPGRQAAGAWPRPPTRSSSRVKPGECCSARRAALFRAITL